MLRKFVSIKNVGRFRKYGAGGDVDLKKYSLVFAENGRGKTTMCAILRSLQSGDTSLVVGRKTLGQPDPPEVEILTDSGMLAFRQGAWTGTVPELLIFDTAFVSENVHSGDVVDVEHRRSLYRVIVGKQGVDLAKEIEGLDARSRAKATEINDKAQVVRAFAPAGMTVDGFVALEPDAQIAEKISTKEREFDAVRQSAQISARAGLIAIQLASFSKPTVDALLAKTLDNVAADVELRVKRHIDEHALPDGQRWLAAGLTYNQQNNRCPFCNQRLDPVADLIGAFKDFFSAAYKALRDEIATLHREIDMMLSDRAIAELERTLDQNSASVEFWERFCEIAPPALERQTIGDTLRALRQAVLGMLDRKTAAPLEKIEQDTSLANAYADFVALQKAVETYNQAVAAANAIVAAKKATTGAANIRSVEGALTKLRATKVRHETDGKKACDELTLAQLEKTAIEENKANAKAKLDEYTEQVIGRYEQAINQFLDHFNAGFRITGTKHAYPGGIASSSYQILINDTPVDLGDASTPSDRPSFRNTLSAGDKSTLALAFFLAQLKHDPGKATKIVVFDDPFNSQDSFRRDVTVQKIKKCGEDCAQVLVLSHDPYFLHRIWERLQTQTAERKALTFMRMGQSNTTIREWDVDHATQAQYRADFNVLRDYHTQGKGNARDVVQKIRPVLESYAKYLDPTTFAPADTLGGIIAKIRDGGTTHQLYAQLEDLEELNDYTSRYHHGEGQAPVTQQINDTELQGYVKRTLEFTGCC
jgi:wobble nucleotide-excising tRNase